MHKKHFINKLITITLTSAIASGFFISVSEPPLMQTAAKVNAALLPVSQSSDLKQNSPKTPVTQIRRKKNKIILKKRKLTVGTKNIRIKNKGKTKMTCKSSNPKIVSVNNRGRLTAKSAGTAKITVKTRKNKFYRKCKKIFTITVIPAGTLDSGYSLPTVKPTSTVNPPSTTSPIPSTYGHWETRYYGEAACVDEEANSVKDYWEKVGYIIVDYQKRNICNACGEDISNPDDNGITNHSCESGYHLENIEINRSEIFPGETCQVWVKDTGPHKGIWHDAQGHYEIFYDSFGTKLNIGKEWGTGTYGSSDYIKHQKYFCHYVIDIPGYWE